MPKRKHLSVCKDACPGLLNLYPIRILTVRSQMFIKTFACTCFLYYNLCLCKSFKERAPEGAHQRSATPYERRLHLICGCKGTLFPETGKTFRDFFQKKMKVCLLYIIYYIRARRKRMGLIGKMGGMGMMGRMGRRPINKDRERLLLPVFAYV